MNDMIINDMSIIEMGIYEVNARTFFPDDTIQEIKVKYVEHYELRDLVRKFVYTVVEQYQKVLFPHLCALCGNCCCNSARLLTAAEIHQIALFLDLMTDEDFTEKYLLPAVTWNRNDGILDFSDCTCPFLESRSSGTKHCRIHPVRPFACSSIQPAMDKCRKIPEKLLMNVDKMLLCGDGLEIQFTGRNPEKLVLDRDDLKELQVKIAGYLSNLKTETQSRSEHIASEAERIIGELFKDFYRQGTYDKLIDRVEGISEVVMTLDNLTSIGRDRPEILERLWKKIHALRDLMENKLPPLLVAKNSETCGGEESSAHCISAIRLFSESMYAMKEKDGGIEQRFFHYRDYPGLLEPVRALLSALIAIDEPQIRLALQQVEPQCTLCGACCRNYSVEISPLDIERLADYFQVECHEICATYLVPGRFSWNYGDYILKWAASAASRKDCIFIRKKSDRLYYCSIYEVRPQLCREYSARNRLCEKTNFTAYSSHYPSFIVSIDIFDGYLYLVTYYTHQAQLPPLLLRLENFDRLNEAYRVLARGLDDLRASLSQPEHYLISEDGSPHVP